MDIPLLSPLPPTENKELDSPESAEALFDAGGNEEGDREDGEARETEHKIDAMESSRQDGGNKGMVRTKRKMD